MTAETKLEWIEVSWDRMPRLSKRGCYLWVSDGTHGYATVLPSSVSIRDALANFEAGHVVGSEKKAVVVRYQMWLDGEIKVSG